jgi:hypothetical protein
MHRIGPRLTYANVVSSIAVFIALGGGAYAAISSIPGPDGVIHGCYKKKGGNLRLVSSGKRCSRREKAIAFDQQGRQGLRGASVRGSQGSRGLQGLQGVQGAKGEQGPQGPGATTFTTTLAQGAPKTALATLSNGVTVSGLCVSGEVELKIETAGPGTHLQISGTSANSGAPITQDSDNVASIVGVGGNATVDFNVIARDSTVGKFARIDVHGSYASPCDFWGMIIPSG